MSAIEATADKKFYSRAELSQIFEISERHVDRLTKDNLLPGVVRLGRLVRYSKAAIDKFVEGQK